MCPSLHKLSLIKITKSLFLSHLNPIFATMYSQSEPVALKENLYPYLLNFFSIRCTSLCHCYCKWFHQFLFFASVFLLRRTVTTPKLMLNFTTCLDVILWLDFSTYTGSLHRNLIIKNLRWTSHNVKLKHVMDLGIELGVSLDFLFPFLFSFQAKPWLWIVPTLINPTSHITLVNPVQKKKKIQGW